MTLRTWITMRITKRTPVGEIYQKAYQLYKLRVLTLITIISLYLLTSKWGQFRTDNLLPLYLVILIEVFVNRPYGIFFRTPESGFKALVASIIIDFMAETAALHLLGNVDLFIYASCFFISIIYCAFYLPAAMTLQMAFLASSLYAGLIALGHFHIIPQTVSFGPELSLFREAAIVIRHIAFRFLLALLVRSLANSLTKKDEQLERLLWELRETNDKIQFASQLQTKYFTRMSHEIRTPLNSILGFSQLILETPNEPLTERQKDFLSRIERSGRHLRKLINNVLDYSRIEDEKKTPLALKEIDLVKVLNSMLDIFHTEALSKKILLRFTGKPESLLITVDELKLRQILYNLISNAFKFTSHGFVHIKLEKEMNGDAKITIEDSGTGIPEEQQKIIFQQYEQTDHTMIKDLQNSGLGLPISKQLVEMHGGTIKVESNPGKGSRFIFTLPPKPPEPPPPELPVQEGQKLFD